MIYYKGRQIDEINAYNVEGATLNNQTKEIEINKNGYAYGESELFDVTTIFLKDTVHATDEEIAAGRRL